MLSMNSFDVLKMYNISERLMMFEKMFVIRDRFDILVKKFLPPLLLFFLLFFIKFCSLISSNIKFIPGNKNLLHHRATGIEKRLFKKIFSLALSNFIL